MLKNELTKQDGILDRTGDDQENRRLINDNEAITDTSEMKQLRVMSLYLRGKQLLNLDTGRDKSDTFVVLKMKWQSDQSDWLEVDQTEVVFDSLDPNWEHRFKVVFNFG